jgi:hypothetical protein
MRVITLAGSPRFPSRSSALLEYAREKLNAWMWKCATGTCITSNPKICSTPVSTARR